MAWTTPRTWVAGEVVTAAIMNTDVRDKFDELGQAWPAYTPTWTTSGTAPSLGNGTLSGAYRLIGKTLDVRIYFVAGSTSTFGTGDFRFALPPGVTAKTGIPQPLRARMVDGSTSYSVVGEAGSGLGYVVAYTNTGTAPVNSGSITWSSGDTLSFTGTIEIN